ncbi:MAG: response regulator [Gemmatimonadetes bacterium]|nr:response regulator [Gemmatimonadota bacterium]
MAYAGGDDAFVRALDCTWGPEPEGKGPVGTAIQTGAPVAVGDLDADPSPLPWRLAARARGVRSALALPLRVNGTVIGGLAVYAREPGAFGPGQQALLAELADDLGFGLQVLQERTEREAAGRALHDSTRRLQLALEMAQLGYWEFDFASERLSYDRHLMAIFRRPPETPPPSALSLDELTRRFLSPEDAATVRREIAAARTLAPGETRQFEHGFRRHDGTEGFMSVRVAVAHDGAGQPRTAYGLSQDITERRAAERSAEQYRRRATAIIDSSLDGIVSVDAEERIVVFNPAAERIFRCTAAEVIGTRIERFIPAGLRAHHGDLVAGFAADPGATQAMGSFRPVQAIRADGESVLLEAVIFKGEVDGQRLFTVACRDVSSGTARAPLKHELEAQLRQAQKMEAIGLLAGGVAHDFNNILGAIMMQVSLVQSEPALPPGALEGLEDIKHSADRAANLTRQLLLFSRKQAMQPKTLDLAELVSNIAKMLQRVLREDIRLQVRHQGGALVVEGDPGMLDQVLLNLAVNARDAMPEGGSLIITTGLRHLDADAALAAQLPPGPYAVLDVTDSGTGIPADVLPHIFEPFFTTKAAGQGTGLGLATVFGIVQQHRGTIHVRSTPGQGTSFELLLPCVVADPATAGGGASRALERPATETVLLVEDEPAVRRLTSRVLERRGYRVLTAAHGREALRLWQEAQGQVQVLVTDIVMPGGLTGQELATRLQGEAPGLKVILMSGYAVDATGRPLQIPEGQVFMQKPISPRELLEAVARALEG